MALQSEASALHLLPCSRRTNYYGTVVARSAWISFTPGRDTAHRFVWRTQHYWLSTLSLSSSLSSRTLASASKVNIHRPRHQYTEERRSGKGSSNYIRSKASSTLASPTAARVDPRLQRLIGTSNSYFWLNSGDLLTGCLYVAHSIHFVFYRETSIVQIYSSG